MEKREQKMGKRTSVYSHVILNYKAKQLISETIGDLEEKAKLADVAIDDISIATVCDKNGNIYFELKFWHNDKLHTLVSNDLDGFEKKFIEFLFGAKN